MYLRNGNWTTEFYHEGVRYKKALGLGISKTVAKEREAKYRREVREGQHRSKAKRVRFEVFCDKYLEHARVNKKPKSAKRNEVSIGQLTPFFKGKLIGSIHPWEVEQYKKARRDAGVAPATVNRDLACLRNMMNLAVQWSYLQVNPIARVKELTEDNEKMWVLTPDEETRLLDQCQQRPQREGAKYLRDLVTFALYTGMRLSEIFSLRWSQVHLPSNHLLVTDTKTHQDRTVPVNLTVREILERRDHHHGHVFTNSRGGKLTVLTNAFWRAVADAGLVRNESGKKVRFRFHDLRHTFGSRLGMNGVDLKTIMEIMGHKTAKVAMRYQHPTPSHKLEAVHRLDEIRKIIPPNITPQKISTIKNP